MTDTNKSPIQVAATLRMVMDQIPPAARPAAEEAIQAIGRMVRDFQDEVDKAVAFRARYQPMTTAPTKPGSLILGLCALAGLQDASPVVLKRCSGGQWETVPGSWRRHPTAWAPVPMREGGGE